MKFGVVCSAGGSAFFEAYRMLNLCGLVSPNDILMLTDRDCEAERVARKLSIHHSRMGGLDNVGFSRAAAQKAKEFGISALLLLYSRLVTEELFKSLPVFNIHPSLLPSFPGFGAIKQARDCGATMLGSTLHEVESNPDSGRIVAQVASPIGKSTDLDTMQRISFAQKTYLSLVFFEHISGCSRGRSTPSASPALGSDGLVDAFSAFLRTRPETVLVA